MRVADAARAFDKTSFTDAYAGVFAFKGQIGLFDDSKRDSETAERRIISVAANVTLPARRVVASAGMRFILGQEHPDIFQGKVVRRGIVAHEATTMSTIFTLRQLAAGAAGTSAWSAKAWVKNLSFSEQSSDLTPEHHIFFAKGEPVAADSIVTYDGRYLVVRAMNDGAAGMIVALCEEVPGTPIESVTLSGATYNAATETFTGAQYGVRVVRLRWQSLFQYAHPGAPSFGPGEIQVVVAKSIATMKAGMVMTAFDGDWKLVSAQDGGDVWLCRAQRRA